MGQDPNTVPKTTQFLRHLRSLVGSETIPDILLKTIWMQRLPPHVQALLQTQCNQIDFNALAIMADKILEVQPTIINSPHLNAISDSSSHEKDPVDQVLHKLSTMELDITSLRQEVRNERSRSVRGNSSDTRQRSRSPSPSRGSSRDKFCWYHTQFGKKANRCLSPCFFKSSTNSRDNQ